MSNQKLVLDMAAMQEDFFADTALIGIVSAMPAYRFCWMLNQKFDMDFVRDADSDICKYDAEHHEHFFSIYKYCTPLNGTRYMIYKLKSEKETLMPEVKQLDYIWMIQSHDPEQDAADIAQHLKQCPDIQMAQVLVPEKLKSIANLMV